jgi:hypothetical protein
VHSFTDICREGVALGQFRRLRNSEGRAYLRNSVEKIDGTAAGFMGWPDASPGAGPESPCVDLSPLAGGVGSGSFFSSFFGGASGLDDFSLTGVGMGTDSGIGATGEEHSAGQTRQTVG